MLLENNLIKTNEKEIGTITNNFFNNITKNLDLKSSKKCTVKDLDKKEYICVLFMDLSKALTQSIMIFGWQSCMRMVSLKMY